MTERSSTSLRFEQFKIWARVTAGMIPPSPYRYLWISNAFSSLKNLIQTYHLDAIDVDYERFPKRSNDSFAYYS
ncbi:hypothetical protein SASPL_142364 [Salvia splendens]|uniref:GH18 domain-containing protein n=1 Tax=Salvia splendens TaxID=180675 RepID=A0A8X8WK24_SALSN|nr:hypothetical protein SASPL_142364 [Salvia splendens]